MTSKLIGRGAFTRAYLLDSGRVLLKTCCPIKEAMAWGWFPESPLFPEMKFVDVGVYEMEYYPRVPSLKKALKADQYALYQTLRDIFNGARGRLPKRDADLYHFWYQEFNALPEELAEVMREALDACANFGSEIGFEISPRNVAVKDGNLVLLDVFFNVCKLNEVKGRK
jgi:hypothetical protein